MKSTDKILIGIVSGIILLVVAAFAVALLRPKQAYLPDDTPEGVAFNYLFALQQGDYERAYSYLSPSLSGYPRNSEVFRNDIRDNSWRFRQLDNESIAVEIDATDVYGKRAEVKIKQTRFYENGLFDSSEYTDFFTITLRKRPDASWKIENAESYWLWCWNKYDGCK